MLRERYDPYSLFGAVPRLALRFEPELTRWAGWGVLAHDLRQIARAPRADQRRRTSQPPSPERETTRSAARLRAADSGGAAAATPGRPIREG